MRRKVAGIAAAVAAAVAASAGCSSGVSRPDPPGSGLGSVSGPGTGTSAATPVPSSTQAPSSAATAVPSGVSAVEVVIGRAGRAAEVHRALPAGQARQLAALVNAQRPAPARGLNCFADLGFRDELTFTTGSRTVTVTVKPDPCGSVRVSGGGQPTRLQGAGTIDAAALAALGLPKQYGR